MSIIRSEVRVPGMLSKQMEESNVYLSTFSIHVKRRIHKYVHHVVYNRVFICGNLLFLACCLSSWTSQSYICPIFPRKKGESNSVHHVVNYGKWLGNVWGNETTPGFFLFNLYGIFLCYILCFVVCVFSLLTFCISCLIVVLQCAITSYSLIFKSIS